MMAKKRKAKTKRATKTKRRPNPASTALAVVVPQEFELMGQVQTLYEKLAQLTAKIEVIDNQLRPLTGLQYVPTPADMADISKAFRSLRVFASDARAQMSAMVDAKNFPRDEFVDKATYDAWKAAMEQRMTAIEKLVNNGEDNVPRPDGDGPFVRSQ